VDCAIRNADVDFHECHDIDGGVIKDVVRAGPWSEVRGAVHGVEILFEVLRQLRRLDEVHLLAVAHHRLLDFVYERVRRWGADMSLAIFSEMSSDFRATFTVGRFSTSILMVNLEAGPSAWPRPRFILTNLADLFNDSLP